MAHLTTFKFQAMPGKRDSVVAQFDRWEREQKRKATRVHDRRPVDSTDSYQKNSDRAEINDWYQALRADLVADPEWFDGTVARESRA